jgi:hypothetical protein
MRPNPYACGTCDHFSREVLDSTVTGAAFEARTCNHENFEEEVGKCPDALTPGCLHHSKYVKDLEVLRAAIDTPNLGFFDDKLRSAANLHSFVWALKSYFDSFMEKFDSAEHDYAIAPEHGTRGDLLFRIGFALIKTDPDTLRVEFWNIFNDAIQAHVEPAFEESQTNMFTHLDGVIAQIEHRYTPLREEVEELRREVERLKDENTDSIRPPLRAAVED